MILSNVFETAFPVINKFTSSCKGSDNTCNINEKETFATNDKKQQQQKESNWTKFQLLRQNERKTETNKQSNKHL